MTNTTRKRKRWSLIPRIVDFQSIDLHLTIEDVMADLDPGWDARSARGMTTTHPARAAA